MVMAAEGRVEEVAAAEVQLEVAGIWTGIQLQ